MLRLRIEGNKAPVYEAPDIDSMDVQVWRDNESNVCAYGYTQHTQHWMVVPSVGSFCFSEDVEEVIAYSSAPQWLILDTYYRSVLPMALQALGQEVLHASAVLTPAGISAFCAVSETGKSTLAYGLSQRGHALRADDAVAIDLSGPGVHVLSIPFQIRLRASSAHHFGVEGLSLQETTPGLNTSVGQPMPLAAIFVLERSHQGEETSTVEIVRLEPLEAFTEVLAHAYCFDMKEVEKKARMVRHYLDLTLRVPVYRLRFRSGLDNLEATLDGIENILSRGPVHEQDEIIAQA